MNTENTNMYDSNGNNIKITTDDSLGLSNSTFTLLKIDFRLWGDTCLADKGEMEVDSNKQLLSLSKKLIECKEYDAIKKLTKQVGKKVLRLGLPASKSFRSGFYRVPTEFIAPMQNLLIEEYVTFLSTVRGFLFAYQDAKYRASRSREDGGLGVLYRESDYPSVIELEGKFSFSWQFISLSVPSNLPPAIERQESEKFRESLQAAREECVEALRVGFAALVDRATERLKESPDGKRLRFQESLTTQIAEFIDSFSGRNSIGNDAQLAQLVERARQIMQDCPNLTALKDNEAMRKTIQAGFASIQQEMTSANLVPRKSRAIAIDQD